MPWAAQPEGWYRGTTLEGADTYASYNRSPTSGWTVALAIPAADVEALTSDIARLLAVGLAVATAIALILAAAYSQRISGPIMALASSAKALGWGAKVSPPLDAPVREVRDVSRALIASAHGFNEREEQLRAADQAKDEFLAMLGHELRNPLGALSSATQILNVAGADDQASRDAAAVVSRQVERMTRLVDDLLDVGRVISGKVRLQPAPLDLGRVVSQLTKSLQRASVLREHRVQLEAVSVWIEGDETRIEQIVSNVLENAGKYTPRNGSISVRVFRDDDQAVFEVTDSGIGMSPDLLPRVFDLFAQGQRSIDRSASGLGIGLTLVKRLAELHGGAVTAESDGMDKGSRFTLRLPAIEAPTRKPRRADDPVEVRDLRKVLLIEDNEDARRSMLTMLRHYGYRTFEAADGFEGVATADEVQPDAAIIDIGLPQYDGYEVAKRLRSADSGGASDTSDRSDRLWQPGSTGESRSCRLRRIPGKAGITERTGRAHRVASRCARPNRNARSQRVKVDLPNIAPDNPLSSSYDTREWQRRWPSASSHPCCWRRSSHLSRLRHGKY